ncbi:hypothetical protein G4H71_16580 [Rhodococcus triatomae]|uniref:Uncharacterized protein n=1 Tax=Rhodococcus triatomae TaxID=300028 RepID=A0A1G8RDY5_9NOCA|nr:hypothetical protein [Rhodococcus triatomae]QNG19652.1 hypothetical protein G4H72_13795 [Rhodococcus triatomae]QNG24433.1 hypothetical protein G4H71_16580 [Rhodococcus triatomae]SDJ15274.1 hypothetical protein SAMN05444695_11790 [Rhodococcus triatomae]
MTHTYDPATERIQTPPPAAPHAEQTDAAGVDRELLVAVASFVGGLVALAIVFANLSRLTDWADQYGTVWVYLGFFLVLSIAGRVFWKGADTLIARLIRGNH